MKKNILLSALASLFAIANAASATPPRLANAPIMPAHGAWETTSIRDGAAAIEAAIR